MFDMNIIYALISVVGLVALFRFATPFLKKNGLFDEVKMALLLTSYAFRDDKVKAIISTVTALVMHMEEYDMSGAEKKEVVLDEASRKILRQLGVQIDDEALGLIIDIVVAKMPKTNK